MFEFLLLVLSLLFIFGSISLLLKDINLTPVGKNLFASLLTYLIPSLFVLISGFSSVLMYEVLVVLSLLLLVLCFWWKRQIPRFECFKFEESINITTACVAVLVIYFILKSILGTVWISLDDSTYHAAIPMLWIKFKSFYVPELTYQAPFPLGGSLFSTFFMTFTKSEYVSSVSEVVIILISICLVRFYCEQKKLSLQSSLLVVFIYFSSADVLKYLKGFSDSDIISGVMMVSLLVVIMFKKEKPFFYIMMGLILGLLLSIKLTNLIFLIPFIIFGWVKFKKSNRKNLVYLFLSSSLVCLPWYIRNLVVYKNPFAPFEKYGFHGVMSKELIRETSLLGIWSNIDINQKMSVIKGFFGWQPYSWVLAIITLGLLFFVLFKKENRVKSLSLYVISSLVLFLLLFAGAPFSGLNESLEINENSSRYLLSWYFLALFFSWTGIFAKVKKSKQILIFLNLIILIPFFINNYRDKSLYLSLTFGLILLLGRQLSKIDKLKMNILTVLFFVIMGSFFYGAKKTQAAKENSIWYLKTINKFKQEKRIAMFDGFIFRGFFLAGERFKHFPMRQNFDGKVVTLKEGESVSRHYFFRGEEINIPDKFCDKFLKESKKLKIDIFIFGKNQKEVYPKQDCENLYSDFAIIYESDHGKILLSKKSKME